MTIEGKTALLIIDLQEDFLPPNGSLAVANGREIIKPIIELLDTDKYKWDAIIATKDWHPNTHISFALVHGVDPYTTKMITCPVDSKREMLQTLWPVHCVQESHGSEFPTEFNNEFNENLKLQKVPTKLVLKGYLEDREYYSCFQDVWGLHKTECTSYLKDNNITNVVAVGIAYDYCVVNSCIDSVKNGFNTFVIQDYTRAVYPDKNVETTKRYEDNGIKVITSNSPEMANWLK